MPMKILFPLFWLSVALAWSAEKTSEPFEPFPINWGPKVGNIQVGLLVQETKSESTAFHQCFIFTRNTNTNKHGRIYDDLEYPKREEMFIPILRDSNGVSLKQKVRF